MDMWKRILIRIGILLVFVALSMIITRWWFGVIAGSDMPDWLKYWILRG